MKSFLIVAGDFVETGGMDRANLALATYIANTGANLHLVGYRASSQLLNKGNVRFHQVPKPFNSYFTSNPLLSVVGKAVAAKVCESGGRVIANGGNCQTFDVNWVHFVHTSNPPQKTDGKIRSFKKMVAHRYNSSRERKIVPNSRVIIVPSRRTSNDLIQDLAVDATRIHIVRLGIDQNRFSPVGETKRIQIRAELQLPIDRLFACFVGGFNGPEKGFDTLFAAWQSLCSNADWDVDLLAVGDGPELNKWRNRARTVGLGSRIRFLGFHSDVSKFLKASNVFVLPSVSESYSLSTQEAICCGIPAFVTGSAGIAECFPEQLSHFLIPDPKNEQDLVMRLKVWRNHIDNFAELVHPFAKQLAEFTWDTMAKRIIEIIELT